MLDNFFSQVEEEGNERMFYGGCKCFRRTVLRDHFKSSTSKRIRPSSLYFNYCLGTGQILSFDAIQELLQYWYIDHQPITGLDDVQIGFLIFSSPNILVRELSTVSYGCEVDKKRFNLNYDQAL